MNVLRSQQTNVWASCTIRREGAKSMDTGGILNALKSERNRIVSALAALEGIGRGRAAGNGRRRRKRKRRLSAAARKRISEAAKARWAKVKKAGRSRL